MNTYWGRTGRSVAIVVVVFLGVALFLTPSASAQEETTTTTTTTPTTTPTTTATTTVPPVNQPPIANAGGPYSGVVGQPVQFSSAGSEDPDGSLVVYVWQFGDGSTGNGPNPTHTYQRPGNYSVALTVIDNDGASDTDSTTASIRPPTTTTTTTAPPPTTTTTEPPETNTTTTNTTTTTAASNTADETANPSGITTTTTTTTIATQVSPLGGLFSVPTSPSTTSTTPALTQSDCRIGMDSGCLYGIPFDVPDIEFQRITRPAGLWWDGIVEWFTNLRLHWQAAIGTAGLALGGFLLWKGLVLLGRFLADPAERLLDRVFSR